MWGILRSGFNSPKPIFYLLKGDYSPAMALNLADQQSRLDCSTPRSTSKPHLASPHAAKALAGLSPERLLPLVKPAAAWTKGSWIRRSAVLISGIVFSLSFSWLTADQASQAPHVLHIFGFGMSLSSSYSQCNKVQVSAKVWQTGSSEPRSWSQLKHQPIVVALAWAEHIRSHFV